MTTKYKLVPIEPTEEMIRAACLKQANFDISFESYEAWAKLNSSGVVEKIRKFIIDDYKAMLEAAPAQESEPLPDGYSYISEMVQRHEQDAKKAQALDKAREKIKAAQESEPVGEVHLQENGLLNCLLWGKAIDDGLVKDGDFIYTHPPADKDAVTSKSILKLLKGLESKTTYKGKDLTLTMFSDGSGRIDDVDGIEIHSFNNLIILKAIIDEAMKG